ncbi:MAG: sigma-70 family RNA polymerase sigma factor [Planctomycetes bacterium]|nr:sigma-70 family RNA polymerase sigma factor [Planctomycetota bacterium]
MPDSSANTSPLLAHIGRFRAGDASALNELIRLAGVRLEALTRRMLRDYPRVRRWAQTDDVLQNALVRLCRALDQVRPASAREFFALAATQVRRELLDLARHYSGPENAAAHHESWAAEPGGPHVPPDRSDLTNDPVALTDWREFHEQVAALPDAERETFGLIFYQGLTQEDAADVLGVSVRTVQRRWQAAMLALHRARGGEAPGA